MKNFLHASPEGFKLDLAEADSVPGIPITVELLKALGCTEADGFWTFKAHGYEFKFQQDEGGHWRYIGPGTPAAGKPGGWHCATHLDECFGFLAEDMYQAGKVDKLAEVRDALGIGGDIGHSAKIKTPEADPS
jgi:hypothetical protein